MNGGHNMTLPKDFGDLVTFQAEHFQVYCLKCGQLTDTGYFFKVKERALTGPFCGECKEILTKPH